MEASIRSLHIKDDYKKDYIQATREELDKYWDFETYPYESGSPYGCPITLYWRQENWAYKPITTSEA